MQRFRLLGFYVVGLVAVIGLAVLGVSMKRTAADAGTPPASEAGPESPSTADTEPSPSSRSARESSLISTTGAVSEAKASSQGSNAKCTGLTKAEVEDLLDWLEAHGQLREVSYQEGKGFLVQ
jgi:hypothetical protein